MKTTTPTPPPIAPLIQRTGCGWPAAGTRRLRDIAGAPVKATLLDEQLVIYRIKGRGGRPRRSPAPRCR